MGRTDRNRYVGKWEEPPCDPVTLPFSFETLAELLQTSSSGLYTHQQIADWCRRFWWEVSEGSLSGDATTDLRRASDVAHDVDGQWDMFLFNTYSFEELRALDLSTIELPSEWFEEWLRRLEPTER